MIALRVVLLSLLMTSAAAFAAKKECEMPLRSRTRHARNLQNNFYDYGLSNDQSPSAAYMDPDDRDRSYDNIDGDGRRGDSSELY